MIVFAEVNATALVVFAIVLSATLVTGESSPEIVFRKMSPTVTRCGGNSAISGAAFNPPCPFCRRRI